MTHGGDESIMKTRRMFSAMLALFPWLPALAGSKPPKPPLILPFAVHKAGTVVTTDLRVVEHRVYKFSLRLGFKEHDREDRKRVQKLAGDYGRDSQGKLRNPGISIHVRLKISTIGSSSERVIYDEEIQEEEMYAYGADAYLKKIDHIELRPGLYRIAIESLQDIPELAETPVSLGIGWAPKTAPID